MLIKSCEREDKAVTILYTIPMQKLAASLIKTVIYQVYAVNPYFYYFVIQIYNSIVKHVMEKVFSFIYDVQLCSNS